MANKPIDKKVSEAGVIALLDEAKRKYEKMHADLLSCVTFLEVLRDVFKDTKDESVKKILKMVNEKLAEMKAGE